MNTLSEYTYLKTLLYTVFKIVESLQCILQVKAESYLESHQVSMMERFCENG